jgi:uncharacterized protein YggE
MSRSALAVAAALALAVSLAGGVVGAQPAVDAQQASHGTTVTASGEATVTAAPDLAVVRVASSATESSASDATAALAANASQLRTALDNASQVASVQTTDFSVFQRDTDNGTAYTARQSFRVEVSNTSAVGEVVDTAVASGATEVFGVEFALTDATRERLRSQAIAQAVADAREQAAVAANAANVTLGPVASVDVLGQSVGPFAERAADAGTVIDASPVAVTASVRVTYNAST